MSTFSLRKLSSWWLSGNNQPVSSLVIIMIMMKLMKVMMKKMRTRMPVDGSYPGPRTLLERKEMNEEKSQRLAEKEGLAFCI